MSAYPQYRDQRFCGNEALRRSWGLHEAGQLLVRTSQSLCCSPHTFCSSLFHPVLLSTSHRHCEIPMRAQDHNKQENARAHHPWSSLSQSDWPKSLFLLSQCEMEVLLGGFPLSEHQKQAR
jgi:hypothetical protein